MATYYVSTTTGNNSNSGTSAALPWATLAFTLGAASGTNPGLSGGDSVYIAPGNYNEAVTLGFTSPSSTVQILGDPLNLQAFPSITPGNIYWYTSGACLTATSKNNITIKNIYFERQNVTLVGLTLTTCYSWTFQQCVFATSVSMTVAQSTSLALTVDRCIWPQLYISNRGLAITGATGANYDIASSIKDCLAVGQQGLLNMDGNIGGVTVTNCSILTYDQAIRNTSTNTTHKLVVKNCLIVSSTCIFAGTSGTTTGDFNHRVQGGVTNVAETNTITTIQLGFDAGYARLTGVGLNDFYGSYLASPNLGTGTATGAPTTDLYGVTWLANPDIGAVQRSASLNFQPQYNPAERNASVITIPPDTTSRAVYVYLGVTGLTFSTTGLAAYYTRGKAAPVAITLVTQTVTGAYASGGFVEVSSTNQPGIYRLDLPNAALVDGVDDVTVTVRGAAGTNGAVLTISLVVEPSSAVVVRMGPYQIKADGLGSSDPLDINLNAAQGIDTQVVDANGSGIDITSATLTVKIYNSGASLVATYTGTATYAADGRLTFGITTAVTGTAGTYTATITRSTSASDTQIFGPLRIYVRDI